MTEAFLKSSDEAEAEQAKQAPYKQKSAARAALFCLSV
jgi:hypothetical protein